MKSIHHLMVLHTTYATSLFHVDRCTSWDIILDPDTRKTAMLLTSCLSLIVFFNLDNLFRKYACSDIDRYEMYPAMTRMM